MNEVMRKNVDMLGLLKVKELESFAIVAPKFLVRPRTNSLG